MPTSLADNRIRPGEQLRREPVSVPAQSRIHSDPTDLKPHEGKSVEGRSFRSTEWGTFMVVGVNSLAYVA